MGNGIGKITVCFTGGGVASDHPHKRRVGGIGEISLHMADPLDEGLGHSFCYVRPDPTRVSSSKVHSEETTTFKTISGASVSANTSTPLSTALIDLYSYNSIDRAAAFESSTSFASIPLQPIPRSYFAGSGPISGLGLGGGGASGPLERGFMSGPIERGFMSGPLDQRSGIFSGPIEKEGLAGAGPAQPFPRSFSHGGAYLYRRRSKKERLIGVLKRVINKTIARGQNSIVAPIKGFGLAKDNDWGFAPEKTNNPNHNENLTVSSLNNLSSEESLYDDDSTESQNLQWAQGKAGEDRVHVVVSEEHGWVFVGIYDGFNGPDAPDYLLSNLYSAVHKELKGLLWDEKAEQEQEPDCPCGADHREAESEEQTRRRWRCAWDRERVETAAAEATDHAGVVSALSRALRSTEAAFLDEADRLAQNPELALMGSCVLVMLMKGEDVYLINVGDSRAVLARKPNPNLLHRINEDDLDSHSPFPALSALQLTRDHSTAIHEEVQRIRDEHPDDSCAMVNDRVKGSLKVTRAFGAGFLKHPKWNDALLEMFRIDYVGTSPYISCEPYVHHHRLGSKDQFLILSSDGLYQYFTNQEAVTEVELFIALQPDGDPAQHLVEEVLFRAAKKAGMDFHQLLEIPQGDRRRYHDDVSIIVISLEGRIWRSCV